MTSSPSDGQREMLRHTLATVAYRACKALQKAPDSFADFRYGDKGRTPGKLLSHLADLFDWALSMAEGKPRWQDSQPLPWAQGVDRFFASLQKFDEYLACGKPVQAPVGKLFQGPIADAFTHIGQMAMLRRMAGTPVKSENFYVAEITVGRVGPDQALPVFEFD